MILQTYVGLKDMFNIRSYQSFNVVYKYEQEYTKFFKTNNCFIEHAWTVVSRRARI